MIRIGLIPKRRLLLSRCVPCMENGAHRRRLFLIARYANPEAFGGDRTGRLFPTDMVAEAYGLSEEGSDAELGARTGCLGCPLAEVDTALDNLLRNPKWSHLSPLKGLRPIYRQLREPRNRLRQPGGEVRKDGTLTSNQNRMGPLTMEARLWALEEILAIQSAVNAKAACAAIDIINSEEETRIRQLIAANTWPQKWTGDEPVADELYEAVYPDGSRQPLLFPTINGRPA